MLVKLMNNPINVIHAVVVSGVWIYDANYKRVLYLVKQFLDLICASSKNDGISDNFDKL